MNNDTENRIFELATTFVQFTNRHLFLTGKAGTGKTTFLKNITAHCTKKMAVLAPTGVAAINAGGVTIHSFFQIPPGTYIHNYKTQWGEFDNHIFNKNQLLSKLRLSQRKRDMINELELLIIDEISMVRADLLDAIDTILRSVRRKPFLPFGGIQMLYIGDLFQLPPVVRQQDKNLLDSIYNSPFFFDALVMQEAEPIYIELKKIYRQKDEVFIKILNNIRNNQVSTDDLAILHEHYHPNFIPHKDEEFITLTSHNYQADSINKQEMERLYTTPITIEASIEKDFPENAYPVEKTLILKEGAQIMFIKNDKGERRRYYNGKIGIVERIENNGEKIFIRFKNEPNLLEMEKETWRNIKYHYDDGDDEIKEETLGSFTHYPIKPAWAVTIHKSQGLTFDKAIIDAGQSFAPGQVYVALSRLTTLNGLVLRSIISPNAIMTNEQILDFSKNDIPEPQIESILQLSQKEYILDTITNTFDFENIMEHTTLLYNDTPFKLLPEGDKAFQLLTSITDTVVRLNKTAQNFQIQLTAITSQVNVDYNKLQERIESAAGWFLPLITKQILAPMKQHIADMKLQKRTKKYTDALSKIHLRLSRKKIQIEHSVIVINGLNQRQDISKILSDVAILNKPQQSITEHSNDKTEPLGKRPKGESMRISLSMYLLGKTIEEIANERNFAKSTIEGHIVGFISTGEVSVHDFISEKKIDPILQAIKNNPEANSGAIKEILGEAFSYNEIKAAQQYLILISEKDKK